MAQITQEVQEAQDADLDFNSKSPFSKEPWEPLYKAPEPPIEDYPLAMPREAMYGYLGQKAKTTQMPLGWAYPSLLTVYCATGINLTASQRRRRQEQVRGTCSRHTGPARRLHQIHNTR
jgi:hypothetical protein